jgi:hypothetical protein
MVATGDTNDDNMDDRTGIEICGGDENGNGAIATLDGEIYIPVDVIVDNKNLRCRLIAAAHVLHTGVRSTRNRLQGVVWPDIKRDVEEWVRACKICQRTRPTARPTPYPSKTRSWGHRFKRIFLDHIIIHRADQVNGDPPAVLGIVDAATALMWAMGCRDLTASGMVEGLQQWA